ncbi:MAG: 1,6-anhydro-N-acetylmuramyl-L-alanine amidase AmpD [Gammaproteobacteria bacterium]
MNDEINGVGLVVGTDGWLSAARRVPSPHADERPPGAQVSLIVIHGVSLPPGEFGGSWVEDFFSGRLDRDTHPYFARLAALRVAPHLYVQRDGALIQFVSCARRAWHAGRSRWQGRDACNDFSIGIELEGTDDIPYTDAQYERLVSVIVALHRHYPAIGEQGVAGHSDIAPGRKTDPGPVFDWRHLTSKLAQAGYNFSREPIKNPSRDVES